jgi:hypothetical protein
LNILAKQARHTAHNTPDGSLAPRALDRNRVRDKPPLLVAGFDENYLSAGIQIKELIIPHYQS